MYRQNIPGFGFPPGPPPGGGFPGGSFPGGGFPGSGFPGGGFPGEGGMGQQPPLQPPPSFTPSLSEAQTLQGGVGGPSTYAVDSGAFRGCLYRYTYVWLRNGRSFWFYPTYIGRRSVAGYRWNGFRWDYIGFDTTRVVAFRCY